VVVVVVAAATGVTMIVSISFVKMLASVGWRESLIIIIPTSIFFS
jgi:hypothetical protein